MAEFPNIHTVRESEYNPLREKYYFMIAIKPSDSTTAGRSHKTVIVRRVSRVSRNINKALANYKKLSQLSAMRIEFSSMSLTWIGVNSGSLAFLRIVARRSSTPEEVASHSPTLLELTVVLNTDGCTASVSISRLCRELVH